MKILQLLISCALFVYFIEIHCVVAASLNNIGTKTKNNSQIDLISNCSEFKNDEMAVSSKEFFIPLNPSEPIPPAHGITYKNGRIFRLEIVNKKFISSDIFRLKHLKRLHVKNSCFSSCNHQHLPIEIECLALSLTDLSIFNTKISHLPEQIGKLKHLQVLKLSNIGLTTLPDSIGDLSSLEHLDLSNNALTTLPDSIGGLSSLKDLYLSNNTLTTLPDSIGDLSSLKYLDLSNNNLAVLPNTIQKLRLLQHIILVKNPNLHSIQPLNGLPSLSILNARHCSIGNLPQDLPQLIDLYMSNNTLELLTGIETLGNGTSNKKSFYFDTNHIQSISPQIGYVKNLFRLNFNNNELKTLPSDIFNIPTLRELCVNNNKNLNEDDLEKVNTKYNNSCNRKRKFSNKKIQ